MATAHQIRDLINQTTVFPDYWEEIGGQLGSPTNTTA
jgi:hypothetical protein